MQVVPGNYDLAVAESAKLEDESHLVVSDTRGPDTKTCRGG